MQTRESVITTRGNLLAIYLIHAVGSVWNKAKHHKPEKLANCYKNSLRLAVENECKAIAFPNMSTGVYNYPKKETAEIAVQQ